VGALEEGVAAGLAEALRGSVTLRRVDLQPLLRRLAGRRLPADKILELVAEWLGKGRSGELIAVESAGLPGSGDGAAEGPGGRSAAALGLEWWGPANARLFPGLAEASPGEETDRLLRALEAELERLFPAQRLVEPLRRLSPPELVRFIRSEPLHTRAIQTAWQTLAERVLKGEVPIPSGEAAGLGAAAPPGAPLSAPAAPSSRHADPRKAARITERLALLAGLQETVARPFPARLAVRPALEALLADPWSSPELQGAAGDLLQRTAALGEEWLASLEPVRPIDLDEASLVLLIDGVPPDLWLACLDLIESSPQGLSTEWARLEAEPLTLPATASLLGLEGDPLEGLEARGVPYLLPRAQEEELELERLFGPRPPGKAMVVRLGTLDREAHRGAFTLAQMTEKLRHLLESRLSPLLESCRKDGRPLILTTDHGLSLSAGALGHGGGGVYERAIFRARWGAPALPDRR
jgi:hypothetical protein